jgi:hypothetical protein
MCSPHLLEFNREHNEAVVGLAICPGRGLQDVDTPRGKQMKELKHCSWQIELVARAPGAKVAALVAGSFQRWVVSRGLHGAL